MKEKKFGEEIKSSLFLENMNGTKRPKKANTKNLQEILKPAKSGIIPRAGRIHIQKAIPKRASV